MPDSGEIINIGARLIESDPEAAASLIKKGVREMPCEGIGYHNLALSLHQQRRIDAAIKAYKFGLQCKGAPIFELSNNLGQDLLLNGEYHEGWKLYESRLQKDFNSRFGIFEQLYGPPWMGWSDTRPMKNLILVAEQGLGDTLQFIRFAHVLEARGISTTILVPELLAPFLRESSGLDRISLMVSGCFSDTLWCPLMSIPHRLALEEVEIPCRSRYLNANPNLKSYWQEKLNRREGELIVALHWQGNPRFERKLYSKTRSLPYIIYEENFANIANMRFVSIQKGAGAEQITERSPLPFVDCQEEFDSTYDFRHTAAILSCCDVLVSADSSVVHLAGALGITTWLALAWIPEWRWGLDGSRSSWYESVRLFRQTSRGDWDGVIKSIRNELISLRNSRICH